MGSPESSFIAELSEVSEAVEHASKLFELGIHPAELLKTLGVTGDAAILPHDVADVFNDGGDVGHLFGGNV